MSYGLLRGAFRPADAICPLRSFMRQAKQLVEDRSRCVLHMQKALTQMNVRLDSVISNIMGKTGERILRAIIAVNGGGIMLHAERPDGPVAAAQKCANHGPLSVATRGGGCTAWSSMRRFDWRLSTRV